MKNKNKYTVDEMLASWAALDEALSCREETRIVPRRRLWRGYLTRHRRQCLLQLLRIVLVLAMLVLLVLLGRRRVYDWLGLLPYMLVFCLLLYALVAAMAALVAQWRSAPYAASVVRRPAVWLMRPLPTVSRAAVLLLLLIVATPTYAGHFIRASSAELRAQAVGNVESLLENM